jgi:hypothetical protein
MPEDLLIPRNAYIIIIVIIGLAGAFTIVALVLKGRITQQLHVDG